MPLMLFIYRIKDVLINENFTIYKTSQEREGSTAAYQKHYKTNIIYIHKCSKCLCLVVSKADLYLFLYPI